MNAEVMSQKLDVLRAAHRQDPMPSVKTRRDRLNRLEKALVAWEGRLQVAMSEDFGHRSGFETQIADLIVPRGALKHARRKLSRWMRPRRQSTPLHLLPARVSVQPMPKGVVGIVSPWNFPGLLTFNPLVDALAAGNRAFIKPSEVTPRTSATIAAMIAEAFSTDEVEVATGGPDVAAAFVALPFDHLIFTGSTAIGRKVARAAAENLVPVTLELGGKSPLIFGEHGDVQRLVNQIVVGKFFNAGQACVAPDYMLVPAARLAEVTEALKAAIAKSLSDWATSDSFTAVMGENNRARLTGMLEGARTSAQEIWQPSSDAGQDGRFPPTLVVAPSMGTRLMQDEIFGPVLPLIPYKDVADAEALVALNANPLALYVFTENRAEADHWIARVPSGAATVNECLVQLITDTIPFGGTGTSGQGAYRGKWGFDELSHLKAVLRQPRLNFIRHLTPPYGAKARALAKTFRILS